MVTEKGFCCLRLPYPKQLRLFIGNLTKHTKPTGLTALEWNAYGKVRQVTTSTATMTFGYDAQQNRLRKTVTTNGTTKTTYYIRDAQGNPLAVYEQNGSSLKWQEQDLYGSSRLGMAKPEREVTGFFWASAAYTLVAGAKSYELSNHLGNVMAVISDRGELQSATDYFPFGMAMPGRNTPEKHRYGFNGKETDPETGIQDYGMRWYLPNIARFPSVDPITKQYPELTPYQFASNHPIDGIDLDGLEFKRTIMTLFFGGLEKRATVTQLKPVTSVQIVNKPWITVEQLHQINPSRSLAELQPWANALNDFDPSDFNISAPLRQAHFLAQISAETDGFRVTVEDMDKSAKRIRDSHKSMRSLSDKEINEYVGQPEKLANKVYGNTTQVGRDMGNDKEGDGYLYIGRGPIQLTGKDSYAKFTKWFQNKYNSKLDFVANPDLLCQPQYGIASALWEFGVDKKGANSAADKDNIAKVTAMEVTITYLGGNKCSIVPNLH
jgi:RHS repeat-associated protein